mmetsp:Transcript_4204/g.4845  ORF Transcript_4204/g.4845 Transcript_4204/m.4845 type:complete len:198 (+) Transcript_4204:981-1574(+)
MMLIYLILMFASFPEIHDWIKGEDGKLFSRLFALVIFSLCIGTLVFSGWYWFKYAAEAVEEEENNRKPKSRCGGCFSGLRDNRIARMWTFLFFLKRFLMCIVIFMIKEASKEVKLGLFFMLQIVFFVAYIAIRPHKLIRDQIIELISESIYILLISFLFFYNIQTNWNKAEKYSFMAIMASSFIIQAFVSLAFLVIY